MSSGTSDASFTSQNQDTLSSLYDFTFRRLSHSQGRWISADPAGAMAVDPTNPQTWNRYGYVANQPSALVDPFGLYVDGPGQCSIGGGDSCYAGGGGNGGSVMFGFCDLSGDCTGVLFAKGDEGDGYNGGIFDPGGQSGGLDFGIGGAPNNACSSALKAANRSAAGVARANAAWNVLQTAANANGIPTALLAAIAVRESNFMNVQETLAGGGPGPGMGVFQLTNQRGVSPAQAFNIPFAANYAAGMLASNMNYLSGAFSFTPSQLLQATAASYNFGVGNISGNPNTIDVGTTGGNYGSTVVGMMACFSHP